MIEMVRVTDGVIEGVFETERVQEGDLVDDLDMEGVFESD